MDLFFRELCKEVINQNVNGDKFTSLLIETGIKLESPEWEVANKILEKGDEVNAHFKKTKNAIH